MAFDYSQEKDAVGSVCGDCNAFISAKVIRPDIVNYRLVFKGFGSEAGMTPLAIYWTVVVSSRGELLRCIHRT